MMFLTDLRPMSPFATARTAPTPAETFAPRVSLFESNEAYWVRLEVPGISPEQIELTFERDELIVKGAKRQETLEEGMKWLRNERTFGQFERSFRFTTPVQADAVHAEQHDGILTIRVAKAPESLPKKINIVAK